MRSSYLALSLWPIALLPLQILADPQTVADDAQFPSNRLHQATESRAHKLRDVFPQLTWLRDTAVEKVFGLPPKPSQNRNSHKDAATRPSSSQLPATLLAKYGGDVVLRFNISTFEEEAALSEAADTLFLDVWEFTDNWADIRLREDDVRVAIYYRIDC